MPVASKKPQQTMYHVTPRTTPENPDRQAQNPDQDTEAAADVTESSSALSGFMAHGIGKPSYCKVTHRQTGSESRKRTASSDFYAVRRIIRVTLVEEVRAPCKNESSAFSRSKRRSNCGFLFCFIFD